MKKYMTTILLFCMIGIGFLFTNMTPLYSAKSISFKSSIDSIDLKLKQNTLSLPARKSYEALRFDRIQMLAKEDNITTCTQLAARVPSLTSGFYFLYLSGPKELPIVVDCIKNTDGSFTQTTQITPEDVAAAKLTTYTDIPQKAPQFYMGANRCTGNCAFEDRMDYVLETQLRYQIQNTQGSVDQRCRELGHMYGYVTQTYPRAEWCGYSNARTKTWDGLKWIKGGCVDNSVKGAYCYSSAVSRDIASSGSPPVRTKLDTLPVVLQWNNLGIGYTYSLDSQIVEAGAVKTIGPCRDSSIIKSATTFNFAHVCNDGRYVDMLLTNKVRICAAKNEDWTHGVCSPFVTIAPRMTLEVPPEVVVSWNNLGIGYTYSLDAQIMEAGAVKTIGPCKDSSQIKNATTLNFAHFCNNDRFVGTIPANKLRVCAAKNGDWTRGVCSPFVVIAPTLTLAIPK